MVFELTKEDARISVYLDSFNKRIRIDDYAGDIQLVLSLVHQATQPWVEKIIIKARNPDIASFQSQGFLKEAFIQGYFQGSDMYFLSKYPLASRSFNSKQLEENVLMENLLKEEIPLLDSDFTDVFVATLQDADELTDLYSKIFKVYPTPLGDPGYVKQTMLEGTKYVLIRQEGKVVSAASAEINFKFSNAELTDCATLPEAQGKGHIKKLLLKLESLLLKDGIKCLYTIARSESYSMNKAFYQLGYAYGGRMTNNCFIFSGLEDMNVWHKYLAG